MTSPDLPSDTAVFITGSIEAIGSWNPGAVKMEPLGDHKWHKVIQLAKQGSIEYKYTLGSWEREGADAKGLPLQNLSVQVNGDTVTDDKILAWTKSGAKPVIHGQITGTVEYHRAMKGPWLKDRNVVVWLPPNYKEDANQRYPVLYMQDGQNAFDPATSAFWVDWQADESADRMIRAKEIPPLIIVGIYNTADRTAEYSPSRLGGAYEHFVVDILKPFIDKTYRTKTGPENAFVCGSSMGGLISFMLAAEYPNVFSAAICMSPAFLDPGDHPKWNYVADFLRAPAAKGPVRFYIDIGGIGLEQTLRPGVDQMLRALQSKNYKEGNDYQFVSDPIARHSESDWAKRLPNALKFLFAKPR